MPGTSQVASTPTCPFKDPKALSWPYGLTEYKRSLTCQGHKMIITNDCQSDSSDPGSSTMLATQHSDIHEKESVKTQLTKLCFIVTFKILTLKVKSCICKVHITALGSLKSWTVVDWSAFDSTWELYWDQARLWQQATDKHVSKNGSSLKSYIALDLYSAYN